MAPFELEDVWPATLKIRAAGIRRTFQVNASIDDVVIDVAALRGDSREGSGPASIAKREIILRFRPPEGAPPVRDSVLAEFVRLEPRPGQDPIENGAARFNIRVPNRLELRLLGLLGYTFDEQWNEAGRFGGFAEIEEADTFPYRIYPLTDFGAPLEVRLPEGRMLEGRVVDSVTGRPMPGVEVYAMADFQWRQEQDRDFRVPNHIDADAKTDADGRFRFTRLDEAPYRIHCRSGRVLREVTIAAEGELAALQLNVEASDWYREEHWPHPERADGE